MKFPARPLAAGAMLAAFLQPSLATMARQPPGSPPAPAHADATSVIERGGTIHKVDTSKKTIVVDGVSYALPASPVVIHAPSGPAIGKLTDLKPGMKIRFNTSKYNFSAQQQVVEIWMVPPASAPSGKSTRK